MSLPVQEVEVLITLFSTLHRIHKQKESASCEISVIIIYLVIFTHGDIMFRLILNGLCSRWRDERQENLPSH